MTRSGDAAPVDAGWRFTPPPDHFGLSLSPDGARLAFTNVVEGNTDIWIKLLPDGPFERLTFDDDVETYPSWSHDGQFVTYVKGAPNENNDVWRRRGDGTGTPELLLDDELSLIEGRGSSDGEWMVFRTLGGDIVGFRPDVDSAAIPLVANAEFEERWPAVSPDGRWLAYTSNETGREEVYVKPFPNVDSDKVPVSTEGGSVPLWANSGGELLFVDADRRLVTAEFETAPGFRIVQRETLFGLGPLYVLGYDITPDDQQFLMLRLGRTASSGDVDTGFILVENWFEELRERMGN